MRVIVIYQIPKDSNVPKLGLNNNNNNNKKCVDNITERVLPPSKIDRLNLLQANPTTETKIGRGAQGPELVRPKLTTELQFRS